MNTIDVFFHKISPDENTSKIETFFEFCKTELDVSSTWYIVSVLNLFCELAKKKGDKDFKQELIEQVLDFRFSLYKFRFGFIEEKFFISNLPKLKLSSMKESSTNKSKMKSIWSYYCKVFPVSIKE